LTKRTILFSTFRIQELENELRKLRNDADARLRGMDEEANQVKKKLIVEIESLTVRLQVS
jgi:hypothetical protein